LPAALVASLCIAHTARADELKVGDRLAELDGATVLDRDGNLVAYGAIVTTSDSEHEGARTAAARTLSDHALVVLKVSVDGDITVFRQGRAVTTLLGRTAG
jgi:DNA integrity scanning protein DisA with diadenylate cyclase activity